METALVLTREELSTTKCFLCKKFLSVPPIVISDDGGKYKCGRCQDLRTDVNTRVLFLENLAKYFSFPCIFEDCEERVSFEEVRIHEKTCKMRTILCPYQDCCTTVKVAELVSHFRGNHESHTFSEQLVSKDLALGNCYVFLLVRNNCPFIVYAFLRDAVCWFTVLSFAHYINSDLKYMVKVTDSSGSTLLFDKQKIQLFDEQQHCFNCVLGECQLEFHKYSQKYNECVPAENIQVTQFNCEVVTKLFEGGSKTYTVVVYDENEVAQENVKYINNDLLRENLECPICADFLKRPICICETGHVICRACRRRLENCPSCRKSFADSRVFVLEKIAKSIELLCKNKKEGCNFMGNVERVQKHEEECSYNRLNDGEVLPLYLFNPFSKC